MKASVLLSVLLLIGLLMVSACKTQQAAPQPQQPVEAQVPAPGAGQVEEAIVEPQPTVDGSVPTAAPSQPVSGPQVFKVAIKGFKFVPADLTVKVGDTVEWTNEDSAPHTATADLGEFDSDRLVQGDSFSFTFQNKGDFSYFCAIHPSMKGSVIVE